MMKIRPLIVSVVTCLLAVLSGALPIHAQDGKLKIHVTPKQAYVFVDGDAIRDGNQTLTLKVGKHTIGVYNYGYTPQTQDVDITQGTNKDLAVTLQASGDKVSGPFGDIELKGHPRAAVLLNGTTPAYFVGQVDEFDNNWIWHQWLLVKPGTYQVTVTQKGQTIWAGPVPVKSGQRTLVYLNRNGEIKTKDFKRGLTIGAQPRFEAGIASATVPVAPVTAQLSASQAQMNCGQSAMLNWNAGDAADTSITNVGNVPPSGDRTVSPTQTTTYELVAKGPGGEIKQATTINVNAQPTATLSLGSPEVRYHKVGDKVVEQGSTSLNWATTNANTVTITPLSTVATSGSQTLEATPKQTGVGPVDETVNYTLNSSNPCGGTATQTVALHIIGSIEPAPAPPSLLLSSIFYPTNYPERRDPKVGLVKSQEGTLAELAANFKNYMQYDTAAKLLIVGHADERGAEKYNQGLSQRRAERAKNYLVSQGIAADMIETSAEGEKQQLDEKSVEKLQSDNPTKPEAWMIRRPKATWLAYNRRVDIILEPSGKESTQEYPNGSMDARILWQRPTPSMKSVESSN